MRSRVIPGSLVTIERRVPVSRLKIVDLPTFGRPTITTDGSFSVIERHNEPQIKGSETSTLSYCVPKQKRRGLQDQKTCPLHCVPHGIGSSLLKEGSKDLCFYLFLKTRK